MLMGIMDLSINQEAMGVQSRFGSHVFKLNKFDETDVKGNNNLYNTRKTDTDNDSGSLFRDGYSSENLQVDPSLFSYSSFKKAMDLRMHNRTDDENRKTIFDDAEYFAKNFFYKLLPITFEQVDETIIHTEHNYSLFSLNSESETEEDCSRTMDYSQIKEKNYKRRRTKFRSGSDNEEWDEYKETVDSNQNIPNQKELPQPEHEQENAVQPLDLSTAPPVQEQKTDQHHHCYLKEHSGIREESLSSKLKCIQVTITRPNEKENYQPCDMFLNDIARLVPRLINNDCFEIEILDRTGDRQDDLRKHRLYYIIAESTWRVFQSTRERVILTNDYTLGPPVKKLEKDERPTFLVFDQFSLAKCLAEYCEEIGGCFEYTCVEEGKDSEKEEDVRNTKRIELVTKTIEMDAKNQRAIEMDEELKPVDTGPENTQTVEINTKSEEPVTSETKNQILVKEDISSDNADPNTVGLKSEKAEAVNDSAENKTDKFEKGGTMREQRNRAEAKRVVLENNETENKEINLDTNLSVSLHPKERKTNKRQKTKRKKAEKFTKKGNKRVKLDMGDMKSESICTEEKFIKIENKTETAVGKDEEKTIAIDDEYPKQSKIIAKEIEEIEMKTNSGDLKICKTRKPRATVSEETIEEHSKQTVVDDIITVESKVFVGGTKSDEKNTEKTVKVQSRKRTTGITETKIIKKGKMFRKAVETCTEETKASVVDIGERKIHKDATDKTTEIRATEAGTKEMKRNEINENGRSETEVYIKDKKTPKKVSKLAERVNQMRKVEVRNKGKRPKIEKTNKASAKKIRKKVKSKNKPPAPIPQIKTRSKSTSESETSQKPNKDAQKPKNTTKEPPKEVGKMKESTERRTRSGKVIQRKQDVKENGARVRGKKRKMEEEVVEERCLRSRGGKQRIGEVDTFGKCRKR